MWDKVPFDKTTVALFVFGGSTLAAGIVLFSCYWSQKRLGYIR
jgi:hypothetical protein